MNMMKASVIFALGFLLVIGVAVIGYRLHKHIDLASKANTSGTMLSWHWTGCSAPERAPQSWSTIVPPAPYFPPGAIWTQDISHAPLDPQSSTIIAWLADAGGWGNNDKMQIDFSFRVLQADANTPTVPFARVDPSRPDSDHASVFPLPPEAALKGSRVINAILNRKTATSW